ncbi:PREDICTED: trans-Golgi network integral membrane protein TGN38-like isoform X2 [Dinoponera quadriceps]|uniref:Trans-Golgi network integral membrane protein TGN38-like isoform X2 n=1 Tax=Dinoponera quadriceps TaxID=609295 RepID=A0A6P3WN43_DINQU|nr:PREDICTED: trans-Golgi network integral membrane protein TGN38-like isoform X2 [Dinoponera quadriceps]
MESRNAHLFRVNCMPKLLVLLLSSVMVTSLPIKEAESVVDVMKKDTNLCDSIQVLYESEYIRSCATVKYPTQILNIAEDNLDTYMCLGVYDTMFKICNYSDVKIDSVAIFNSNVKKFFPGTKWEKEEKFCKDNLQGFTPQYNKVEKYLGPLAEKFNNPHTCQRTCFNFNDVFRPLCAVFAWIKSVDDKMKKPIVSVTNRIPVELDFLKAPVDLPPSDKKLETELKGIKKKAEVEELKEQSHNKVENASNNNVSNEYTQPNTERVESKIEKSNKHETPKTLNTTKTQDHNLRDKGKENINDVKVETKLKLTTVDAPKIDIPDNVPSKNVNMKEVAKGGKAEETNGKAEAEDPKTSTLSENTQNHYGDQSDEVEDPDADGTIQQPPNTENQHENLQVPSEQKTHYAKRTDGDSHFFTYFTVTTVACIACYIGYHNKQKILAIVLEGRRSRNSRGRRRPSTASYRKLDCTLEEAVTSQCNANVTHVIY